MTTPEKGRPADDAIFCDTHRAVSLRLFGCPICEEQRAQRAESERDALRDELVSWHKGRNVRAEAAEKERDALRAERDAAKSQLNELHGYVRDMVHRLQPGHHAPDAWALRDAILAAEAERDSLREQLRVAHGVMREYERKLTEVWGKEEHPYAVAFGWVKPEWDRALATQDNGARAGDTPKRLKLDLPTGWNTPDGCEPPEPTDTPEHPHIEGCTPYDGHDDTGCADACPHNQSALRRYGLADPTDTKPEPSETTQHSFTADEMDVLRLEAETTQLREALEEIRDRTAKDGDMADAPVNRLARVALEASGKTKEADRG